jgi:SecY interacting protein Syd
VERETALALEAFTARYCEAWQTTYNTWPQSDELHGVPSPCIVSSTDSLVTWQPQPFLPIQNVNAIERALDIVVQPALHAFYTTQFAGDMRARFQSETFTLLQTWSPDDFQRVQENLIGHLVTQKRLKLSPTLFIATLESDTEVISLCNLSGEVVKETLGRQQRVVLASSLADFLSRIEPVL